MLSTMKHTSNIWVININIYTCKAFQIPIPVSFVTDWWYLTERRCLPYRKKKISNWHPCNSKASATPRKIAHLEPPRCQSKRPFTKSPARRERVGFVRKHAKCNDVVWGPHKRMTTAVYQRNRPSATEDGFIQFHHLCRSGRLAVSW